MSDGKYLHLRCACHILNLITGDGLTELNSSIEAVRNCVIHSFRQDCHSLGIMPSWKNLIPWQVFQLIW